MEPDGGLLLRWGLIVHTAEGGLRARAWRPTRSAQQPQNDHWRTGLALQRLVRDRCADRGPARLPAESAFEGVGSAVSEKYPRAVTVQVRRRQAGYGDR